MLNLIMLSIEAFLLIADGSTYEEDMKDNELSGEWDYKKGWWKRVRRAVEGEKFMVHSMWKINIYF